MSAAKYQRTQHVLAKPAGRAKAIAVADNRCGGSPHASRAVLAISTETLDSPGAPTLMWCVMVARDSVAYPVRDRRDRENTCIRCCQSMCRPVTSRRRDRHGLHGTLLADDCA